MVISNAFIDFGVVFCIYEYILKNICWHDFGKCPEVWTIFVRIMFWDVWGFWVLNGPSTPTPIPGVNVKVPFWGKNMESNICLFFCDVKKTKRKIVLRLRKYTCVAYFQRVEYNFLWIGLFIYSPHDGVLYIDINTYIFKKFSTMNGMD